MKKLFKFLLWVVGGLAVLLILAVLLVMFFVDPNDYKDEIAKLVKDSTGRDLTFTGDISLSFFPWLGVEVDGASLSNAPGFGDEPMAEVGMAGASVRIMPLLSGDVEIGTVRLRDVRLNLAVDEQGKANWDDLGAPEEIEETGEAAAEPVSETAPEEGGGFALRLGGVEVENLSLVYDDRQSDQHYEVGELHLVVGEVEPGKPFDFDMAALATAVSPDMQARIGLSGQAGLDIEAGLYEVAGLTLHVSATGQDVPGGQGDLDLVADTARLDLTANKAELEGFTLNAYGAQAGGFLAVSDLDGEVTAAGALEVARCNGREVLAALGMGDVQTTDPEALTSVAASAQFAFRSDVLTADKVELNLDETSIKASVSATNLSQVPEWSFVAVVDDIDLDRYLPPGGDDEDAPADTGQAPESGDIGEEGVEESPVEALRTLILDGQASVGRLKLAGGEFTDITLTVTVRDGVLDIEPVALSFYGGTVKAAFRMDAGPPEPLSSLDVAVARVNVGQALKAMTGRPHVTGVMNLVTTQPLTFEGLEGEGILETLAGGFDFTVLGGTLPAGGLASDILVLSSTVLFTSGSSTLGDNIAYDSIVATNRVNRGVIRNDYMLLKSPSLWAQGAGLIDLNRLTIDYQAATKLVSDPDPNEKFEDVTAPEVAVYATGSLEDPTVETGVLEGLGNLGLNVVEGLGEGAVDVVVGVGEAAGGLVEGLFDLGSDDGQESGQESSGDTQEEETNVIEDIGKSLGIEF